MKKAITHLCTISMFTLFVLSGCQKYDDGGLRSKGEARLTSKTWTLHKCELISLDTMYSTVEKTVDIFGWDPTYNKYAEITNVTNEILIKDLNLYFSKEGVLELSCKKNNTNINEVGTWNLDNTYHVDIRTEGINSIQLTNELFFNPEYMSIHKLKNNKLEINIRTFPVDGCSFTPNIYSSDNCLNTHYDCPVCNIDNSHCYHNPKPEAYRFYFKGN